MRGLLPVLLLSACFQRDKDDTGLPPPDDSPVVTDDTAPPTDADGDGYAEGEDCDDGDASVHPGAEELCNGVDDDCDGTVDEEAVDAPTWYGDGDGDGWGSDDDSEQACQAPDGAVVDPGDCDDEDPGVHPEATEICDGLADENCDGLVDDGCGPAPEVLLSEAEVILWGATEGDKAGFVVDAAGDVNGDGWDDLIVGAPDADYLGDWSDENYQDMCRSGAALLVYGPITSDEDLTEADAWIQGDYALFDYFAGDVGSAVDGDEYRGMAALFLGPLTGVMLAYDADTVLTSGSYWAMAGTSVAGGGDSDGDGGPDYLVSAPVAGDGSAGEVYLGHGSPGGTASLERLDGIVGIPPMLDFGGAVDFAGDVDGDGLDDVLVGAEDDSSAKAGSGSAHLFLSPIEGVVPADAAQLALTPCSDCYELGRSVAGIGDLDDDGYADYAVGMKGSFGKPGYSGALSLLYGSSTGGPAGTLSADATAAFILGEESSGQLGRRLSGGGDPDGDGVVDFMVGSTPNDGAGGSVGVTWIVSGPTFGVSCIDDLAFVRLVGASGENSGAGLAFAGDLDGDGLDDLAIGASGEDTVGENAGAVYLLFGSSL
jgi:hypothetical protein